MNLEIIHLIYIYKKDLALNNNGWYAKVKPNPTFFNGHLIDNNVTLFISVYKLRFFTMFVHQSLKNVSSFWRRKAKTINFLNQHILY